jgi:hypothetical protein
VVAFAEGAVPVRFVDAAFEVFGTLDAAVEPLCAIEPLFVTATFDEAVEPFNGFDARLDVVARFDPLFAVEPLFAPLPL